MKNESDTHKATFYRTDLHLVFDCVLEFFVFVFFTGKKKHDLAEP